VRDAALENHGKTVDSRAAQPAYPVGDLNKELVRSVGRHPSWFSRPCLLWQAYCLASACHVRTYSTPHWGTR